MVYFCIEGEINVGKLIFLNLLLGEKDFLIVKVISCIFVIMCILYGIKVFVCVIYESGNKEDVFFIFGIEVNK